MAMNPHRGLPPSTPQLIGRGGRFSGVHEWPVLGVHRGAEHAFALNATTSTVPEPGTYALLGTGLFALFVGRRRRRV
jgi:hypothetical protein